jgi:hypothetical protein
MGKILRYKQGNYVQENSLDSMKVRGVIPNNKALTICFSSNGENSIHIWFRGLVLEYMMLY